MTKRKDHGMFMTVRLPPKMLSPLERLAETSGLLVSDVLRVIVALELVRQDDIAQSRRDADAARRAPARKRK
jgi:hypothetical protein